MTCYWWLKRGLRVEFVKQHIGMLKETTNIWIILIKKIDSSYIEYLESNNLAMSQKLPVNDFEWVENLFKI